MLTLYENDTWQHHFKLDKQNDCTFVYRAAHSTIMDCRYGISERPEINIIHHILGTGRR